MGKAKTEKPHIWVQRCIQSERWDRYMSKYKGGDRCHRQPVHSF